MTASTVLACNCTQPLASEIPLSCDAVSGVEGELDFSEVFEHGGGSTSRDKHGLQDVDNDYLSGVSSPVTQSVAYFSECRDTRENCDCPRGKNAQPLETQLSFDGHAAPSKLGPRDFELLRVVGQGAFGKVFQVRQRESGQIYAMKVMRKDKILEQDHSVYVKAERDVLTAVFHPYIVTLRYSFQTSSKLYLVLDFINGGHLFFQLYRQGIFSEELSRLYTAEIVLAVAHLHALGFVHRDLKPENVLLDSEGHVRITDFGLSKGNMNDDDKRTNSFIGTMEYMAPEIVAGKGHGKAVDWWSVGILLYEMLCGLPPFHAKSRSQLQKQILSSKLKLQSYLGPHAQSLLKSLLHKEPSKRLGSGVGGSAEIMKHPFFKSINWAKLEAKQIPSPFKPTLRTIDSVENFDKIWTDITPEDSPAATPRHDANVEDVFKGFSYSAPSHLTDALMANLKLKPGNA